MDNCYTGRRDRSRQTTEKVMLFIQPAGPVKEGTFARCRLAHASCLERMTSSRLFRCLNLITPSKLIAGLVGRALPVHWIGY